MGAGAAPFAWLSGAAGVIIEAIGVVDDIDVVAIEAVGVVGDLDGVEIEAVGVIGDRWGGNQSCRFQEGNRKVSDGG